MCFVLCNCFICVLSCAVLCDLCFVCVIIVILFCFWIDYCLFDVICLCSMFLCRRFLKIPPGFLAITLYHDDL